MYNCIKATAIPKKIIKQNTVVMLLVFTFNVRVA